jgi:hypothetical protein
LALLDFHLEPTVVVIRPVLRIRFGARLVPPSTDGLAFEKGFPGTATVATFRFRECAGTGLPKTSGVSSVIVADVRKSLTELISLPPEINLSGRSYQPVQ